MAKASATIDISALKVAGEGASKYITEINDSGISVHAKTAGALNYVQINSSGMEIFKSNNGVGTVTPAPISVASFGESTRIGKYAEGEYWLGLSSNGIRISKWGSLLHGFTANGIYLNHYTSILPGRLQLANSVGDVFVDLYSPNQETITQTATFIIEAGESETTFDLISKFEQFNITLISFSVDGVTTGYTGGIQISGTSIPSVDWYDETKYTATYISEQTISGPATVKIVYEVSLPKVQLTLGYGISDRIELNEDGLKLFQSDDVDNPVIDLGAVTYIGKHDNTQSYLKMDYRSLQLIDKEGNTYFYVSDLRDQDGTVTEIFTGDGTTKRFNVSVRISVKPTITVDGESVTAFTWEEGNTEGYVVFDTAPAEGAEITIKYTPSVWPYTPKAYSIGIRGTGDTGVFSVEEGYNNVASGTMSHAEGRNTLASGNRAHAEGGDTKATAAFSHAEGYSTEANNRGNHAEGWNTATSGDYGAHAEGRDTLASGWGSHAEGYGTEAIGNYSHAQNMHTITDSDYQTALGKYNVKDSNDEYAVIIGNGTSNSAPSNALTVDWNGRIECGNYSGNFNSIFDIFYPIGSYYETSLPYTINSHSYDDDNLTTADIASCGSTWFDPRIVWGGEWELETAGLVHVSAGTGYAVGSTGGSATHTLTSDEVPLKAHSHQIQNSSNDAYFLTVPYPGNGGISRRSTGSGSNSNNYYGPDAISRIRNTTTESSAATDAISLMQPYIAVNRWHRIG